jgi:drug/metabolite transporter (DMT)-like permease
MSDQGGAGADEAAGRVDRGKRKGLLLGATACVLWSATFPCLRWIFTHHEGDAIKVDPVTLAWLRYLFAGVMLFVVVLCRGRVRELAVLWRRPWVFLFLAATGIAGMGVLVALANELTQSITAAVLMNANPVLIVLLGAFIGERLTAGRLGGVAVGLAGCLLVVAGNAPLSASGGPTDLLGCVVALVGALCWAVYTLASKSVVRAHGGLVTTSAAILLGAVLLGLVVVVFHRPVNLQPDILLIMAFVGLVPTALAFTLWNAALSYLDAGAAGPLQYLSPVGAMILAGPTLGEVPTWSLLAGLALIASGIMLCTRDELRRRPESA